MILQGEDYRNRNEILDRMNRETDEGQSPGGIQIDFGLSEFIPGSDSYARSVFDRADAMMYLRKKEMKQARRT